MAKQRDNYLDYVPAVSPRHTWDTEADGSVTIHMEHRGVYAAIAQKLFHCPKVSHIHLDEMGSFVFPLIDGKRTVGDIADLVGEHFGEAAGPDIWQERNEYCAVVAIDRNGDEGIRSFNAGKVGMFIRNGQHFGYVYGRLPYSANDEIGFIPMPKASEDAEYVSVYELYGLCIEKANPDPQRSAYILSELSKILNDPSYEAINIRGLVCDEGSVEMIMEYVRPNSVLPIMYEVKTVTDDLFNNLQGYYADLDYAKSLDEIISTYDPQLQAALDELFEQ